MPLLESPMSSDQVRARALELLDRAVVTAAEGALLAIGGESVAANALAFDWSLIAGYAAGGAFLSIAINLARGGLLGTRRRQG